MSTAIHKTRTRFTQRAFERTGSSSLAGDVGRGAAWCANEACLVLRLASKSTLLPSLTPSSSHASYVQYYSRFFHFPSRTSSHSSAPSSCTITWCSHQTMHPVQFVYITTDDRRQFLCAFFTVLRATFRSLKYIHCTVPTIKVPKRRLVSQSVRRRRGYVCNIVRYGTIWIRDYERAGVSLQETMSESSRGEAKKRKDYKEKKKGRACGDAATHRNNRTQSDTIFRNKKKRKNTDDGEGEGE